MRNTGGSKGRKYRNLRHSNQRKVGYERKTLIGNNAGKREKRMSERSHPPKENRKD